MPFVKIDCGILNSTLWFEREAREVFLTALLMAEPIEITEPMPQIAIQSLEQTGWSVPVGWYGFVPAASVGILHRAGVSDDVGMAALEKLGNPEQSSRSPEFEGRRLIRVSGGFVVLNYMKYRDRDYTMAQRSKRYRDRLKGKASQRDVTASHRDITQAEAEAEAEAESRSRSSNLKEQANQEVVAAEKKATAAKTSEKPVLHKKPEQKAVNGRSRHPVHSGQRFVVFDWMLEDISRILGPHTNEFDVSDWFWKLDARMVKSNELIPPDEAWPWLKRELLEEARKRGLPILSNGSTSAISTQGRANAETMARAAKRIMERDS